MMLKYPGWLTNRYLLIRGVDVWGADCRKKDGRVLVGERVGISANLWVPEILSSLATNS